MNYACYVGPCLRALCAAKVAQERQRQAQQGEEKGAWDAAVKRELRARQRQKVGCHYTASDRQFKRQFADNPFAAARNVQDRLWFPADASKGVLNAKHFVVFSRGFTKLFGFLATCSTVAVFESRGKTSVVRQVVAGPSQVLSQSAYPRCLCLN